MLTVIVPSFHEQPYLNRTIANIISTASIQPEIIVVDSGGNGDIDPRAKVISPGRNVGERIAMNLAAKAATNEFLLRIDAHCDFSPQGWDVLLCDVTGERVLTMTVLTALRMPWDRAPQAEKDKWLAKHKREDWHDWERLKGHWYGLTRLIVSEDEKGRKGLEAKWQGANKDHVHYKGVHPTMAATGCGMCIRKSFYEEIGGADETLPPMGAIGEEFAVKAWLADGKCQTQMDVTIGHIFGTGGYPTGPVKQAQQALFDKYGDRYDEIAARFPTFEGIKLRTTAQPGPDLRTVIVTRTDTHDTKDPQTGKLIRRRVERFRYIWEEAEHPTERKLTDKQIEEKYAPQGVPVGQEIIYYDEQGNPVPTQEAVLV